MKIATWNVNSIRARDERLFRWLEKHKPDVLCLQEIKIEEPKFPIEKLKAAGYHAAVSGQRTYNGVAILSRTEIQDVQRGLRDEVDDPQARLVEGRINGVRVLSVYIPNGSEVGSDKYAYKLRWLQRLRAYMDRNCRPDEPLMVCGDLNVAPEDIDVARPDEWRETVLCHTEAREGLRQVCAFGLHDAFRTCVQEPGHYSWWDYRALGFPKNNGLRIDHVLVTDPLKGRCRGAAIDREERKGKLPSDHAPVVVDVEL